jgi:hypothetical protein
LGRNAKKRIRHFCFLASRNEAAIAKMSSAEQEERFVRVGTNALAGAFVAVDRRGKPHDRMRIKFEKRSA